MKITLEELAEKLGKTVWQKEGLKRIYLNDAGYNTKKMSTKTYIFEQDSEFIVSCRIDCPSQAIEWIKSQEKEVRESVYSSIQKILFEIENPDKDYDEYLEEKEKENEEKKRQAAAAMPTHEEKEKAKEITYLKFHIDHCKKCLEVEDEYPVRVSPFDLTFLKSEKHADQIFLEKLPIINIGRQKLNFEDIVEWVFSHKQGRNGPNKKNVFIPKSIPDHVTAKINEVFAFEQEVRKQDLANRLTEYAKKLEQLLA